MTTGKRPAERTEWNASVYHQVSNPHVDWGQRVIAGLDLAGNETVIDAGCGTGRVTAMLLERLPHGRVIGVDLSQNMLDQAEESLSPRWPGQVGFIKSDLLSLTPDAVGGQVDLVFSTATFHWVRDHDLLFQRLFDLLAPAGRLLAQCGGGPNIAKSNARITALTIEPPYAEHFADFDYPWLFATPEETEQRMRNAGFIDVETSLISAPALMDDADAYARFITTVVYRDHLQALPTRELQVSLVESLTDLASHDDPPFELDYWRLNLSGTRPA